MFLNSVISLLITFPKSIMTSSMHHCLLFNVTTGGLDSVFNAYNIVTHIGLQANFSRGLSHLCPKNFSTVPEKTAMLTCKITLPDSPHPVIISKNPGFRALYLARQNKLCFFVE